MNEKGISPLIATVLLIAFVVGAAAILSNFVLPFTRERAEEVTSKGGEDIQCGFANIHITDASWNSTNTELTMNIENVGREDLEDFKASIIRTNNTVDQVLLAPLDAELQPGDIETFSNSTDVVTCSDIDSVVARSDTCPVDAKDEIQKADISNC